MDIKKSIEKRRIIYNNRFWSNFWALLIPGFLTLLILTISTTLLFDFSEGRVKNDGKTAVASLVLILMVILIILYLNIDNLKIFKGETRHQNKKLVINFIDKNKLNLITKQNNLYRIKLDVKYFAFWDDRYLTIMLDGNRIYYNCTTFETVKAPNAGVYIENFKSPLYWFANKKVEQKFRNFLFKN